VKENYKLLPAVEVRPAYYDELEKKIMMNFLKEFFWPLMDELSGEPRDLFQNTEEEDQLIKDIFRNKIIFNQGRFTGKFSAKSSKKLKELGAKWDKKTSSFKLRLDDIPVNYRSVISVAESRLTQKLHNIDKRLEKLIPAEIADSVKLEKIFDAAAFKMDKDIKASMKGISIQPDLTDEGRTKITDEYVENSKIKIKDWTKDQTVKLRKAVQDSAFAGNRYESIMSALQNGFEMSKAKAKQIARQETKLLLSKFKETRYTSAGVDEYMWKNVVGSANHPVRPMHKLLNNTIQRWDSPPIVDEKGNRKHPGCDFGCRCYARAVVRF
jgi:SPP1 gp7 family putative phage head morphogenesis protein